MTETTSAAASMDSGFACLAIVSRFFGKLLDPDQLRHEFANRSAPADAAAVLRAAKRREVVLYQPTGGPARVRSHFIDKH